MFYFACNHYRNQWKTAIVNRLAKYRHQGTCEKDSVWSVSVSDRKHKRARLGQQHPRHLPWVRHGLYTPSPTPRVRLTSRRVTKTTATDEYYVAGREDAAGMFGADYMTRNTLMTTRRPTLTAAGRRAGYGQRRTSGRRTLSVSSRLTVAD